jgi:hypothetical protein
MAVDNPRGFRRTDTDAFRRRNAFVDWSRLRWRLAARSGNFKSISLRQRTMRIGNAYACLGKGLDDRYCTARWSSEFHCRQYANTQWDEEAQQHHSQHDVLRLKFAPVKILRSNEATWRRLT